MRVAAIQLRVDAPRAELIERAADQIRRAASEGARLVLLPELYSAPFVQPDPDLTYFAHAESAEGPSAQMPQRLSAELGITIVGSIFEQGDVPGTYFNTAQTFVGGELRSTYRKSHLPFSNGFPEKFYFRPGSKPPEVVVTQDMTVGTIICYERHFPELGRIVALAGGQVMCVPVASASTPMREVFQLELRAQAVFNSMFVVCANRIGTEGVKDYFGLSAIYDPDGSIIGQAKDDGSDEAVVADIDITAVERTRERRPFLRDRRPDLYSTICTAQ